MKTLNELQNFCNVLVRAVESVAREDIPFVDTKEFWLQSGHDRAAEAIALSVTRCRQAMDEIRQLAGTPKPPMN